jgi:hypothetical protein
MATIVTLFPGVCSTQASISLTGAVAVCAKVTEGTEYSASPYQPFACVPTRQIREFCARIMRARQRTHLRPNRRSVQHCSAIPAHGV